MNLIHSISPRNSEDNLHMIVENPRGGENKYEVNKEFGIIGLDRVLRAPMPFPFEYGFIPGTWNEEDDDPCDIMAIMSTATFPGCLLTVRAIGMYKMDDTGETDNKIIAVSADDPKFSDIKEIEDLPEFHKERIDFYWSHYKNMTPDKYTKGLGWEGKDVANEYIEKAIKFYAQKIKDKK